jgi:hypothetical protein
LRRTRETPNRIPLVVITLFFSNASSTKPPTWPYHELIERLVAYIPHLINVQNSYVRRKSVGAIYCIHSLLRGGLPKLVYSILFNHKDRAGLCRRNRRIRGLKSDRVENVRTRYILVEDLAPWIIENLGSTFWLNPDFLSSISTVVDIVRIPTQILLLGLGPQMLLQKILSLFVGFDLFTDSALDYFLNCNVTNCLNSTTTGFVCKYQA